MIFWVRYERKQLSKCPGRPQINQGDTNGNPGVKQWTLNTPTKKWICLCFPLALGLWENSMSRSLCGPHPIRWWAGAAREAEGPLDAQRLGRAPLTVHKPLRTKPWPLWEGTRWGPPAVGTAVSSPSPPQICATLQPYLPGESCFSSQAGGGGICLLHQSSQDGNPHPESLPFTFPVTKTLLLSKVLLQSYLSYQSYPQPPAPTPSWTLPEPSLPSTAAINTRPAAPDLLPFHRNMAFPHQRPETGRQHSACTFFHLLSPGQFFVNRCSVRFVTCLQRGHHSGWSWGSRRPDSQSGSLTDKPPHH